jgi:hypothetical protein
MSKALGLRTRNMELFQAPINSFPNGIPSKLQEALMQLFSAPFVSEPTGTYEFNSLPSFDLSTRKIKIS